MQGPQKLVMEGPSVWYTLGAPGCAPAQHHCPVQGSGATRFHGVFRPFDGRPLMVCRPTGCRVSQDVSWNSGRRAMRGGCRGVSPETLQCLALAEGGLWPWSELRPPRDARRLSRCLRWLQGLANPGTLQCLALAEGGLWPWSELRPPCGAQRLSSASTELELY